MNAISYYITITISLYRNISQREVRYVMITSYKIILVDLHRLPLFHKSKFLIIYSPSIAIFQMTAFYHIVFYHKNVCLEAGIYPLSIILFAIVPSPMAMSEFTQFHHEVLELPPDQTCFLEYGDDLSGCTTQLTRTQWSPDGQYIDMSYLVLCYSKNWVLGMHVTHPSKSHTSTEMDILKTFDIMGDVYVAGDARPSGPRGRLEDFMPFAFTHAPTLSLLQLCCFVVATFLFLSCPLRFEVLQ